MSAKRRGKIAIYKPNKKNTGGAAQFEIGYKAGQTDDRKNDCVFLEVAKQTGHQAFDWGNKINFKLGIPDICAILAYWDRQLMYFGKQPEPLKLFHRNDNSGENKTLELRWQEREYKGKISHSYYLSVSHQAKKGGNVNRVGLSVDLGEVEYLKVGLKKALEVILDWDPR